MIRTALLVAMASAAMSESTAQCRPVVPEAYETTSAGPVWLRIGAERGSLPSGAPHMFVGASISRPDRPGARLNGSILNIWVRRDSAWTRLRIQPVNDTGRPFPFVHGLEGPAWDPGTPIDVLTEWQLAGERASHCTLLRSTVSAATFNASTVILRQPNAQDATVAPNTGRLVIALRDAGNPLVPIRSKSLVVVDTGVGPPRSDGGQSVFRNPETDIIKFDGLPPHQVSLMVQVGSLQLFRALVNMMAGCETVIEVYLGPRQPMHGLPVTPTHATVTTCAPPPTSNILRPDQMPRIIRRDTSQKNFRPDR